MEKNIYKIGKELFITNDEEIKEGNWFVNLISKELLRCFRNSAVKSLGGKTINNTEKWLDNNKCKKIILTTDPDLIKDGVQAIDDEFLEWFVKNPSCESVEVGYGWIRLTETGNEGYWVSIPDKQFEMQQEEPKQETNMSNITANQLIKNWKKTLESEWIQLDNLDEAKLVFDEEGNVVVENEHGTQFPVSDLSDIELDIFYTNLI